MQGWFFRGGVPISVHCPRSNRLSRAASLRGRHATAWSGRHSSGHCRPSGRRPPRSPGGVCARFRHDPAVVSVTSRESRRAIVGQRGRNGPVACDDCLCFDDIPFAGDAQRSALPVLQAGNAFAHGYEECKRCRIAADAPKSTASLSRELTGPPGADIPRVALLDLVAGITPQTLRGAGR